MVTYPFFAQLTGAFQENKAINSSFLNDPSSYTWQFINHMKEGVHVALGTLIELLVNRQRTAIHTVPSAFQKEGRPLLWREPLQTFLETIEPISYFHFLVIAL